MSSRISYELLSEQLGAPLPDDRTARETLYRLTARAISERLPARQQTVLRLCFAEGLTVRQAAEKLNISAATVSRDRKRACATLRDALEYALEVLTRSET